MVPELSNIFASIMEILAAESDLSLYTTRIQNYPENRDAILFQGPINIVPYTWNHSNLLHTCGNADFKGAVPQIIKLFLSGQLRSSSTHRLPTASECSILILIVVVLIFP
jgi:hypothetical protein